MTAQLVLTPNARVEFGFGTVTPGKEEWMYGEYFPAMGPTMAEHGLSIMAGFGIIDTNFAGGAPKTGSLARWPSAAKRAALHADPKFLAIQPARDAAMDLLSGGHLFQSLDDVITLNTDSDYAIIVTKHVDAVENPIIALPLTEDSPDKTYAGKSLILRPWGAADADLLSRKPEEAEVFRVRFSSSAK